MNSVWIIWGMYAGEDMRKAKPSYIYRSRERAERRMEALKGEENWQYELEEWALDDTNDLDWRASELAPAAFDE